MCEFRDLKSSLDVLVCFGRMVQPLIGGKRSIKCVVDEGDIRYVRDVGLLLQLLHIQHPVGQYLVRAVQCFVRQHHIGTATLLFWCHSFARVAVSLTEQGLERKEVDRLMRSVLEECIQHTSTLTIHLNLCSDESEPQSQSLFGGIWRKSPRQSGSNKSSMSDLLEEKNSQKKIPKKVNRKEEKSKKLQQRCKDITCPCTRVMNSEKQSSFLKKQCSSRHVDLKVEFDLKKQETEIQDVNLIADPRQKKPKCTVKEQLKCTSKENPKALVETETDLLPARLTDEVKDSHGKDDIPVIQLKMKNLENESEYDFNEETDWFFETSQTVVSGNEMQEGELIHTCMKDKVQDGLNMENLKQKWDTDLLNDIKDLKEGIESDLKIVSERRERLNKKLAKYIKVGPNTSTDYEFDDCFEDLEKGETGELGNSEMEIDNFKSSKAPESTHVHMTSLADLAEVQITSQNGCADPNKTFDDKISNRVKSVIDSHGVNYTEDSELMRTSKLFENNSIANERACFSKGNPKWASRQLNEDSCQGVDSCAFGSQVHVTRKESGKNEANITTELTQKSSKSLKSTLSSRPAKIVPSQETASVCKEHNLHGKSSMHKIDSLLVGLGITDKKIGTELKINKTSRHLNEIDSDKEDVDDVSFTMTVIVDKPIAHPQAFDLHGKQERLEGGKRKVQDRNGGEDDQKPDMGQHQKSQSYPWLYELIRGLCPDVESGNAEVVQQVINKQLGTAINHNLYQRDKFADLSGGLMQCHSEVSVLPRHPELADGLIISTTMDNIECIQQLRGSPCRMVLVNGDLQPNYHHKGYKKVPYSTAVGGVELMSGHVTQTDQWLMDVRAVLKESSVNLVLVRGLVCEQVKLLCQQEGIVIMETVPYKSLEILAEACQTDMVTYITLVSENNISKNVTASPWRQDWMDKSEAGQHEVILKVSRRLLQTVVFRELTSHIACLKEQDFWECFHLVTSSLKSGQVLPGAGRTEASCMEFCWRRAAEERSLRKENQAETYLSVVFDELANAFKEYVDIYTANTGTIKPKLEGNSKQDSFKSQTLSGQIQLSDAENSGDPLLKAKDRLTDVSHQSLGLYLKTNYLCGNHSMQVSQDLDHQHLVNQSRKAVSDLDDRTESQTAIDSYFCDTSPTQPLEFSNYSNYLDDCATKLAAWRTALDTVFMILGIDSFIQTGLTDENMDRKCHSVL